MRTLIYFMVILFGFENAYAQHGQNLGNGQNPGIRASHSNIYFNEWKRQHGADEKNGVSVYTGNEWVFKNNARKFSRNPFYAETAKSFLSHLHEYSMVNGCIPKLTFAGHGWGNPDGGPGLPMANYGAGFYTDKKEMREQADRRGIFRKTDAGTLGDLEKQIKRKKITFCDRCLIQLHSCNISNEFGSELSRVSGCQLVMSAGLCSPISTPDGSLDHHWVSSQDGGRNYSGFMRFTPSPDGKQTIAEQMGRGYIAK